MAALLQRGQKVVFADNGQTVEHVEDDGNVEDDGAGRAGPVAKDVRRKLLVGRWRADDLRRRLYQLDQHGRLAGRNGSFGRIWGCCFVAHSAMRQCRVDKKTRRREQDENEKKEEKGKKKSKNDIPLVLIASES